METLNEKSLDRMGLQTLRTRLYITSGEGDSKEKLIIKFVMKDI